MRTKPRDWTFDDACDAANKLREQNYVPLRVVSPAVVSPQNEDAYPSEHIVYEQSKLYGFEPGVVVALTGRYFAANTGGLGVAAIERFRWVTWCPDWIIPVSYALASRRRANWLPEMFLAWFEEMRASREMQLALLATFELAPDLSRTFELISGQVLGRHRAPPDSAVAPQRQPT